MRTLLSALAIAATLACGTSYAHGQKATERYIPIGQSPGLSGKYTSIALITDVSPRAQAFTIADSAGPRTVQVTKKTRIWLDRSKLKRSNLVGDFADLRKGRRVEVKYEDHERREVAEWVKVEISAP
jgi:hypothetical protein